MKTLQLFLICCFLSFFTYAIQLELTSHETCLDYLVENPKSMKRFYFHYNHNIDSINMVLYFKHGKQPWYETGFGINYKTSLEVPYQEEGNYTLCFHKKSEGVAHVTLEIINEDDLSQYVGKEQLAKISRRISEFLMDIKRVGFTFKQVLEQHNSRKQTIQSQQNSYGYLLILKTAVMLAIVGIQIMVIKKIFK